MARSIAIVSGPKKTIAPNDGKSQKAKNVTTCAKRESNSSSLASIC